MRGAKVTPYHAVGSYPLPLGFNGRLAGVYRWFSGRPMNGHRYTDATGFRYGTMALDVSGHATGYQLLPGMLRFLYIRLPLMVAPVFAASWLFRPRESALMTLGLTTLAGWRWSRARARAKFRREVSEPLGAALGVLTNSRTVAGRAHTWVDVPANFRDDPLAKITVRLPPAWLGEDGDRKRMTSVVSTRLALDDLTATWTLSGRVPNVTYVQAAKPPRRVDMATGVQMATGLAADVLAMGEGIRGHVEVFDLGLESPHLMVAGGSGAGKSELIAYLAGQWLGRIGGGLAILDAKFVSHPWARTVPGVLYAAEEEELHEALVWMDAELLRRARAVSMDPSASEGLVPLLIVLEEMNAASNRLRAYWKSIKSPEDPALSPALTALANLAAMGREMRIHIVLSGQSVTAKVTGGPEARENFGGRALARATAKQWAMLAPQIKPAPVKRQAPGRWHLVVGDTLKEFQAPFVDLKERETPGAVAAFLAWATGGRDIPDVPAMMAGGGGGREREKRRQEAVPPPPEDVSIKDYAAARMVDLAWLRRQIERRPEAPSPTRTTAGNTRRYSWGELDAFVAQRLREPVSSDD